LGITEARRRPAALPLLVTKLHPPPRREQTIARDRLVERLRAAPGIKLTVVAAPAGSGKTTLLGAWRELEQETSPVAWLTLDEGDNDPVVLWSYVLAALREAVPALEVSVSPERVGAARLLDVLLPHLVNGLSGVGDAALILDDFHRLSSGPARDSMAWLIDRAPASFRLILATRSEPALPLAALRAHAALLEVRAADLAFTRGEAEDLLNERLELELEPESVEGLVERTEGWPAGLYLAGLSLQAVDDRQAFVTRFGGESRHVVDFLVDEALDAYDPATQVLMLRSSILDRLCGPLCDAVLEHEGSAKLLDSLARTNLFLMPLDDRGEWYRFHHLFAQLLRVELEHREPGRTAELHLRAFAWHREHGSFDEAIDHALQAAAFAEAGELIATRWIDYVYVGRHETVLAWLERFPDELLQESPALRLVQAWILSLTGRREAAMEAIDAVEQLVIVEAEPLPDGFSSLEASLATLRGTVPWGDFGTGLENALRASELEPSTSPYRPVVCLAVGAGLYYSGLFDEADRWLEESTRPAVDRGQWRVALTSLALRSLVADELGFQDDQTLLAGRAVELAREHGLEEVEGELFIALGASLETQQRFDEALSVFERGVFLSRPLRHPRTLGLLLIRQAALLQAMGRRDDAVPLIEEARMIVDSCPDPRLLAERLEALERQPRPGRGSENGELSERELVVLRMLGGRLSERDIGRELYLSHNTVHSHTKSIYRKLGVSSRSEALQHARELGLI
jgi:LuxR family transcriptional regulator, maltose regulon positive regulatory protein